MTTASLKAPTAHSHSRLMAYTQCPLSYKLSYMDKVGVDDSDAMEIGAAAHEFFDQWVKRGSPSIDADHLAATCFQKEARNQSNFKEYLKICKTFAEVYKPDPEYPNIQPEIQLAFDRNWHKTDWFSKDVMFRAKIDLLETDGQAIPKKVRITDYKTGYAGAMDSFQLDIYSLAVSILFPGVEQIKVQFYYVQSGFKQVKLLEVKDLDITKVQIESLIMRVEGDTKFKAKPGARCLNCPVASFCDQKASDLIAIEKVDQAETLGAEIAFLEAQAKAKKKTLKAWCEKQGPVTTGGLTYNNWPTESYNVQIAPLLGLCVRFDVDPAVVLNPDTTSLKKVFKQKPDFAEAVAPYTGVDVSTRFGSRKAEAEE